MRPDFPLPLRTQGIGPGLLHAAETYAYHHHKAQILHPHGHTVVELKTDSPHLRTFFLKNWEQAGDDLPADAEVIALRGDAAYYGLDPAINGVRSYYRPKQQVLFCAHEAYANLKITIRGLCSQVTRNEDIVWLHGCSLNIRLGGREHGVVLLGRSGGGKTTVTATLRRMLGSSQVRVVNDDWGAISLARCTSVYTGEAALHMKYMSVNAHDPTIHPSPHDFPSEHFSSDPTDPVPRMLIPRSRVFGSQGIAESCPLTALILLRRAPKISPGISNLGNNALQVVEAGEYSDYYDSVERFFNGSLFMVSDSDRERHRKQYAALLASSSIVGLGNVEYPHLVAEKLLTYLNAQGVSHAVNAGMTKIEHDLVGDK